MTYDDKIGIFGGDKRYVYMALSLLDKNYHVCSFRLLNRIEHRNHTEACGLDELMKTCRIIISPIPLTKDLVTVSDGTFCSSESIIAGLLNNNHIIVGGMIPPVIEAACKSKGAFCCDLMKNDRIAVMNAIATAEGAIMEAIKNSDINLHHSNCLILGYGRCGRVIADKLRGLSAVTIVADRDDNALAYASAAGHAVVRLMDIKSILPGCHYIFNTIPALIMDQEHLKLVSDNVVIIDIASAPGGVDYEYALNHGINAKLCLGIPGKVAPKASADILVAEIEALIKERSG